MARILNVEKSKYFNDIISMYTQTKLGQYSKFLNMTPTFVTYYHINQPLSRTDVGTGSIETDLGPRSPIRFNKIYNFPIYNVPELHPDMEYDESMGADINLEAGDITVLPGTIKPTPGDYILIQFANTKEFLFRVNNFNYNTIQSNDYYKLDMDLRVVGVQLEEKYMQGQVVEEYYTVFENIGTEDRCFIKSTDVDYLGGLANLFYKLRDYYKSAFYIRDLNSFTFQTGRFSETGRPLYRYDGFLEAFINKSHIYYDENSEETLIVSPASELQDDFDFTFGMTLYDALLKRSTEMLRPYCYLVTNVITMPTSIYNVMGYVGESASLYTYKQKKTSGNVSSTKCPCGCDHVIAEGEVWYDIDPMPRCTPTWTLSDGNEYFNSEFLKQIIDGHVDTDDYFELIIFNFLHGISMEYDRKEIINALEKDEHCFYYLPMVIYIIREKYSEYFATEQDVDM